MTPRDLIAAARRQGFRRWQPTLLGNQKAWQNGHHRVVVEMHESFAAIWFYRADLEHPGQWIAMGTSLPTDVDLVGRVLSALGVLPSPTGVAA